MTLAPSVSDLKRQFLLEPEVVFLNHGSFGATPKPVFEAYQGFQRRLEAQPVRFFQRELPALLQDARVELARYLGAPPDNLVFVPNATFGVNVAARSLALGPGDEVLASDHEYGACERVWSYWSEKRGFDYRKAPVALPLAGKAQLLEQLWPAVTERTRVLFLSHISSPTAVTFPVRELCRRARSAGILTVVDGAHAPGQLPLELPDLGADLYVGNCHKWLLAPKGAGFLYVRPERQALIEPLVGGWGLRPAPGESLGSSFQDNYA